MRQEGRQMFMEDDVQGWALLLAALNIHVPLAVCFLRYVVI
jgi:hypothetical protein